MIFYNKLVHSIHQHRSIVKLCDTHWRCKLSWWPELRRHHQDFEFPTRDKARKEILKCISWSVARAYRWKARYSRWAGEFAQGRNGQSAREWKVIGKVHTTFPDNPSWYINSTTRACFPLYFFWRYTRDKYFITINIYQCLTITTDL